MARKLKIRLDDGMLSRLEEVSRAGGYSSVEELVRHILEKELGKLSPAEQETEDEIRRKLEGLGYME